MMEKVGHGQITIRLNFIPDDSFCVERRTQCQTDRQTWTLCTTIRFSVSTANGHQQGLYQTKTISFTQYKSRSNSVILTRIRRSACPMRCKRKSRLNRNGIKHIRVEQSHSHRVRGDKWSDIERFSMFHQFRSNFLYEDD